MNMCERTPNPLDDPRQGSKFFFKDLFKLPFLKLTISFFKKTSYT